MTYAADRALAKQFALIRRSCVRDGRWAALWHLDRGSSVSVTPVMLLLARGRGATGAITGRKRLCDLAGIGTRALARAESNLAANGLIEPLTRLSAQSIAVRVRDDVLATQTNAGFFFPARLLTSRWWAELSPGERCTLFALAGELRGRTWDGDDFQCEPEWLQRFLTSHSALRTQYIPNPYFDEGEGDGQKSYIPRFGPVSMTQLAKRTGMNRGSVSRAIELLRARAEGDLIAVLEMGGGFWYHLPDQWWAPVIAEDL